MLKRIRKIECFFFYLTDELAKMENDKAKIDSLLSRKANYRLIFLFLLLGSQTALFYHLIFNVDYLGWDLMEPVTFLFSSFVFMAGLFYYIKLNKKYNTVDNVIVEVNKSFRKKKYLHLNFNIKKYDNLKKRLEEVKEELNQLKN